ncbi:hypothetical protein [Devosia geojensis]|uniref:hypothetical protein n=1 Tax=Devosia geojensis TaxID=443610 RepID=UPI00128E57E6|nr:hypothetical protein [Devosia geojensis]
MDGFRVQAAKKTGDLVAIEAFVPFGSGPPLRTCLQLREFLELRHWGGDRIEEWASVSIAANDPILLETCRICLKESKAPIASLTFRHSGGENGSLGFLAELIGFVKRVRWRKEDRMALLNVADEVIKPLLVSFDKGRAKGETEQSDKAKSRESEPDRKS